MRPGSTGEPATGMVDGLRAELVAANAALARKDQELAGVRAQLANAQQAAAGFTGQLTTAYQAGWAGCEQFHGLGQEAADGGDGTGPRRTLTPGGRHRSPPGGRHLRALPNPLTAMTFPAAALMVRYAAASLTVASVAVGVYAVGPQHLGAPATAGAPADRAGGPVWDDSATRIQPATPAEVIHQAGQAGTATESATPATAAAVATSAPPPAQKTTPATPSAGVVFYAGDSATAQIQVPQGAGVNRHHRHQAGNSYSDVPATGGRHRRRDPRTPGADDQDPDPGPHLGHTALAAAGSAGGGGRHHRQGNDDMTASRPSSWLTPRAAAARPDMHPRPRRQRVAAAAGVLVQRARGHGPGGGLGR